MSVRVLSVEIESIVWQSLPLFLLRERADKCLGIFVLNSRLRKNQKLRYEM